MKLIFEFLPIILFFVAFKLKGIYAATAVMMVVSVILLAYGWFKNHKVDKVTLVSMLVLLILGGSTLLLHNPRFIQWKPSIIYWLFALIISIAQFGFRKNIIRAMLEKQLQLPDPVWSKLSISWAIFFAIIGIVNLAVAYLVVTDPNNQAQMSIWVNFKLFGIMGAMLVFIVIQTFFLSPYLKEKSE